MSYSLPQLGLIKILLLGVDCFKFTVIYSYQLSPEKFKPLISKSKLSAHLPYGFLVILSEVGDSFKIRG
jgi:hypothetical protein